MGSTGSQVDVDQLLLKLTLEEKVSLLAAKDWWRTPIIDREGVFVPHIKTTDGPNGARGESYVSGIKAACFPCSASLGASFDTNILYRTGQEIAKEAQTKAANILLAPTLNVMRSPLGGRNYETYSEDPTVLGHLAAAFVNGCQSMGIAATPKHFVANEAENRRTTLSVEVSEQTFRELYLYPFQLVMKLSTPLCFMTSYNRVNGVYVAENERLIEDVLRKEWGFRGLVLSDWMGTYSTADAINAGLDLEMPGPTKWRGPKLLQAIQENLVSEDTINKCTRRVLALARTLGRFESPNEPKEYAAVNPERDNFIRDSAAESMVLLKNEGQVLPIPEDADVAVIGHLANVVSLGGGGSARVDSVHAITLLQGLEKLGVKYRFAPGVPVFGALPHADPAIVSESGSNQSLDEDTRLIQLEWFNGSVIGERLSHEEHIQRAEYMIKEEWPQHLDQEYCTKMTFDITPQTSGNHTFSVISTGRAKCYIDGNEVFDRPQEIDLKPESFYFFKAKLERRFQHKMIAGQRYTCTLEAWACDPERLKAPPLNGKMFQGASLRFFEHYDIPHAITSAASTASNSEYAVICVGNTNEIESEGYDRDTMDLSSTQYDLIHAVAAANSKTIVVNFSGAPITMTQFVDEVPAIIQAWFPGQECGHSVAKVLTGLINPCGHLPMSWPKCNKDNPSFNNFPVDSNDILRYGEELDVGYRYYDRETAPDPLFPFGFGLSYTTFVVSDVQTSTPQLILNKEGTVTATCRVENTGSKSGKVSVQFYVELPTTSIGCQRPLRELKAFTKVPLRAGESKAVAVTLDKDSVSFYDAANASWRAQKGTYTVLAGISSRALSSKASFVVPEEFTWTGV